MQSCSFEHNASIPQQKLDNLKPKTPVYSTILGLDGVVKHLSSWIPYGTSDQFTMRSSLHFDEAFEIFNSFSPIKGFTQLEKQAFRNALLHPNYGLRVTIFNNKGNGSVFLTLRRNDMDINPFLKSINDNKITGRDDDVQFIQDALQSMDTE